MDFILKIKSETKNELIITQNQLNDPKILNNIAYNIEFTHVFTDPCTFNISAYFGNKKLTNAILSLTAYNKPSLDLIKDHGIVLKTNEMPKILPIDDGIIKPRIMMNNFGNILYFSGYMLSKSENIKIPLKFNLSNKMDDFKFVEASYYHAIPGIYSVWIKYDDKCLEDVPFRVEVVDIKSFIFNNKLNYFKLELGLDEDCFFHVSIPHDVKFCIFNKNLIFRCY